MGPLIRDDVAEGNASVVQRGTPTGAAHVYTMFPRNAVDVTKSDSTVFDRESAVRVDGAGTIAVQPAGGGSSVSYTLEAGEWVPVMVTKVLSTGTTATGIVRHY